MDARFFTAAGQSFTAQEAEIGRLQGEVASGKRVATASADPAAYVGAQEDAATVKGLQAMDASQINLQQTLDTATSALGDVATALDHVQSIVLQAMSGTSSTGDFQALGEQVGEGLQQIVSLANTRGSDGNYVFAGTAMHTQPFVETPGGAVGYHGNDGTATVEISPGVTVNGALSGSIFTNAPTGNGFASVSAAASNAGAATVLATGVGNAASATAFQEGNALVTLSFAASANGGTTYTATSGSSTLSSGPIDTSNGATPTVTLNGVQFTVSGDPAPGDSFTIVPSRPQSIFAMVKSVQQALTTPGTTPATRAQTRQLIGNALGSIVQYQHKIAGASAKAGVVLQAARSAVNANAQGRTNAQIDAGSLVSADMPKVLTQLQDRTASLQAAMKAFSVASQLSLFKYL